MKPCPSCNSPFVGTSHDDEKFAMKHVTCSTCWMEGPHTATVEEAIAAWNNLPRKIDPPKNFDLTLTVGETEYLIAFMHVGPATFCGIMWENGRGHPRHQGTFGASYCNPKDAYDARIGEKLAMRKACGIGLEYVWADLTDLYSAYRKMLRDEREMVIVEQAKA